MRFRIVETELRPGVLAKGLVDDLENLVPAPHPIVVDFESSKLRHRLKNSADSEAIVKAVGVKRSARSGVLIYDFTAGLGTEAFILARAGFTVIAFERDQQVFELLEDGLRRYRAAEIEQNISEESRVKLEFRHSDALKWAEKSLATGSLKEAFAVTLDPMFESESTIQKSQPKKEMALLRRMLPVSGDEALRLLMTEALQAATDRVIVKRPAGSIDLTAVDRRGQEARPIHRLYGKTARFDIYSCR